MDKSTQCLIGRQPILDNKGQTQAYELLFRNSGENCANIDGLDSSYVSASVILDTVSHFGTTSLLGEKLGFVNMELELIMSEAIEMLAPEQIVIELLETMAPSRELIDRCRQLKKLGFRLALDDHAYTPEFEEFYGIVDIVKYDILASRPADICDGVRYLKNLGKTLLAEKVETQPEYEACRALGFDLFQGYFFARPTIVEKRRIDEDVNSLFSLMRLMSEDGDTDEVEAVFATSPGLTYKLLMLVNSAAFTSGNTIKSVRHALSLLGQRQLRQWVQLSLFASRNGGNDLDSALMDLAATRASLMEQLARIQPQLCHSSEQAFMTGILSLMEAIYGISMTEISASLNLPAEVAAALTTREGLLGKLLLLAASLESMSMTLARPLMAELQIAEKDAVKAQIYAYAWKERLGR